MPAATATSLLQQALSLDAAGDESAAIPLYRRAIAKGLSKENLHTALIGLGSSLRTVGETQSALRTLRRARKLFPRDAAITLFIALAHADARQERFALRQLADCLLNESSSPRLTPYRRVLARKFHALR